MLAPRPVRPPAAILAQFKSPHEAPGSLKDVVQLNVAENLAKITPKQLKEFWSSFGHLHPKLAALKMDATLVTGTTLELAKKAVPDVQGVCVQP